MIDPPLINYFGYYSHTFNNPLKTVYTDLWNISLVTYFTISNTSIVRHKFNHCRKKQSSDNPRRFPAECEISGEVGETRYYLYHGVTEQLNR